MLLTGFHNTTHFLLLIFCLICTKQNAKAQTTIQQNNADSLYYVAGDYIAASQAYLDLAKHWEVEENMDSAFHKYLFAIKSFGQANLIDKALSLSENIIARIKQHPKAKAYLPDVYFEKGYCELVIGERNKCILSLSKALEEESKKKIVDSLKLATILQYKGLAQLQSGALELGRKAVVKAHEMRKALLGEDHIQLAESANMVYMVYDHLYQYESANRYISEAYRIMKIHLEPSHPHFAVVINNYSNVRSNLGDPFHAKELLLEAIASNKTASRLLPLAMNYYNLANLYFDLEEYEIANAYYVKSLEIGDTLISDPSLERSNLYDGLGKMAFQFESLVLADSFFNLSLQQNLQLVGEESLECAQNFHNLGLIAYAKKSYGKAKEYFSKSTVLRKKLLNPSHPLVFQSESEIAHCLVQLGQRDQALMVLKKGLVQMRAQLGNQDHRVVQQSLEVAKLYIEKQFPDSINQYLQLAWAGVAPMKSPSEKWNVNGAGEITLFYPVTFELLDTHLSYLFENPSLANQGVSDLTISLVEKLNAFLPKMLPLLHQQQAMIQLGSQLNEIYSKAVLIVNREEKSGEKQQEEFYLQCLHNSKAYSIRVQLQNRKALTFAQVPDSIQLYEQELKGRIWALKALKNSNDAWATDLAGQEIEVQSEWSRFRNELSQIYPLYYSQRFQITDIDFLAIRKRLKKQKQSLLAYFLVDEAMLTLVFDGQKTFTSETRLSEGQLDSVVLYNTLINQRGTIERILSLGYYLYQQFFETIDGQLQPNVLLFPDGPLSNLNFELLLLEAPSGQQAFHDIEWLLKKYAFQYANHLDKVSKVKTRGKPNLAVAPGFAKDLKEAYLKNTLPSLPIDSMFLNWVSTPWSVQLLEDLKESCWGNILLRSNATKHQVKRLGQNAKILHFATHALVDDEYPLKSFLVLNPNPQEEDDGYLYASDLYSLELNNDLVVLSACQTGLGRYHSGEGVLSLAHAFQYAGTPSMVYSLWSIDDQQTNKLVKHFYQELGSGSTIVDALRNAKLTYLQTNSNEFLHPYYWGGMVMMGENQQIFNQRSGKNIPAYLIGFVLFMVSVVWFFKKR